nr:MAG TPA: hypothetical protein [Caudoviricetes sp.]
MAFAIGLLKNIYGNISAQEIAGRFPSIKCVSHCNLAKMA